MRSNINKNATVEYTKEMILIPFHGFNCGKNRRGSLKGRLPLNDFYCF